MIIQFYINSSLATRICIFSSHFGGIKEISKEWCKHQYVQCYTKYIDKINELFSSTTNIQSCFALLSLFKKKNKLVATIGLDNPFDVCGGHINGLPKHRGDLKENNWTFGGSIKFKMTTNWFLRNEFAWWQSPTVNQKVFDNKNRTILSKSLCKPWQSRY